MIFDGVSFTRPAVRFDPAFTGENCAPMFRKKFQLKHMGEGRLYVCGLGYGYFYLNGVPVSEDKFTAPVSDYSKTLWYNVYDVTGLLREGENILAAWCGNGWYNEEFKTTWEYYKAPWRDIPKFILRLTVDGETAATSGEGWKCCTDGPIWFNALRSGEYFDARKFQPDWTEPDYDDSGWGEAVVDDMPPTGILRECRCEPVREFEVYRAKQVFQTGEKKYIFDLEQNISGYIRLTVAGESGQLLTIRYAEQMKEDGSLELNYMYVHYPESKFQTDKFICSGRHLTWSPRFAYHGFRYIEIEGIDSPADVEVSGVFVHQAVETRTRFHCSDEFLNTLFRAGQFSVYSNMFYMLTDCPTREKLGWTNDAQSSVEQILLNFKSERFFEKWLIDIYDAMDEKGALPGVIPSSGWGYEWGNGPVSDGVLFELPYQLYRYTGNTQPLKNTLPFFERYFQYLAGRTGEDGFVHFGLDDWARPGQNRETGDPEVPVHFINALLIQHFYEIAALAVEISGKSGERYAAFAEELRARVRREFIVESGRCRIHKQTAVAMLIYYHVYERLEPLKEQLKELIEAASFHHDCGMVGLRRLYMSLNLCGLEEYAYRILTAEGYPSYRDWFKQGAVTLWEYWDWQDHADSKNHHMYSDFMSWMVQTILGIRLCEGEPDLQKLSIAPYFLKNLDYAEGSVETCTGKVNISWKREGELVRVEVDVPADTAVFYRGKSLLEGKHIFKEKSKHR